jgi:hypothetical protein
LKPNSKGDGEVYMVGNREELPDMMIEDIQWETDMKLACVAHLAREAERGKWHNDMRDDSGASEGEPGDGAPVRRPHPKFNSWGPADQDQLRN